MGMADKRLSMILPEDLMRMSNEDLLLSQAASRIRSFSHNFIPNLWLRSKLKPELYPNLIRSMACSRDESEASLREELAKEILTKLV